MCGRYTLKSDLSFLQQRFKFLRSEIPYKPRYNIAPTQDVLTVTNDGQRHAQFMRWGLIPFWAKDLKIGYKMINAVSETAAEKPAFRTAFRKRRCLVLADGFFEWIRDGKTKIPYHIFLKSGEPFAFAGLWDSWKSPKEEVVHSCTIMTCQPNEFMAPIHNRMPVILDEEAEALWLDPMTEDPNILKKLLVPAPWELMGSYEISPLVNSPKNKGPEIIEAAVIT